MAVHGGGQETGMDGGAPIEKDVVLIGGGHSHVTVLKAFGMKPEPGTRLTVLCREVDAPYSGMLPGLVAGHYDYDDAHIDLRPLAGFAAARLFHDEAVGLDLDRRRVVCRSRPPVPFDVLSIDIGATPRMDAVPGAAERVVPVKPIDRFFTHWKTLTARVLDSEGPFAIGVVGGGAGGVELLLSVEHRLRALLASQSGGAGRLAFHLMTESDDILPTHNERTRAAFRRVFTARGIHIHAGRQVVRVDPPGRLVTADGGELDLDEVLWVTAAGAPPWLGESGLDVDPDGFVRVAETLESISHPGIFAAGDIAAVVDHPRPKSGVFAVRQGPPLAANLRRALGGRKLKPFRPQHHFLGLISTGEKYAVASRGGWAFEGRLAWHWKDWIDRRFMGRYRNLPAMRPVPGAKANTVMRCGGCGAKVGPDLLARALAGLTPIRAAGLLVGLDRPDDAAVTEVPAGKVLVQSTDGFRAFIDDPYVFGRIAANHALGDLHAMGAAPWTALANVTLPYAREDKLEDTLAQVMAGALEVLSREGAALIGGHTAEGAELALGFAVNGLAERDALTRKGGLRPGDRLILTKPLGTGTLFAADMRRQAKGRWIAAALESMAQSLREAAGCLRRHGAVSCTDVTGFGLVGHLAEMARPSGVDLDLDLSALPVLDGALETAGLGILSTLHPQNARLARHLRNAEGVAGTARHALLFDPQTAGGLLAGLSPEAAGPCLAELRRLGYDRAAIVGTARPAETPANPVIHLLGGGDGG